MLILFIIRVINVWGIIDYRGCSGCSRSACLDACLHPPQHFASEPGRRAALQLHGGREGTFPDARINAAARLAAGCQHLAQADEALFTHARFHAALFQVFGCRWFHGVPLRESKMPAAAPGRMAYVAGLALSPIRPSWKRARNHYSENTCPVSNAGITGATRIGLPCHLDQACRALCVRSRLDTGAASWKL